MVVPCNCLVLVCVSVLEAFYLTGLSSEQSMQTGQLAQNPEHVAPINKHCCRGGQTNGKGEVLWTDFVSTGRVSGMALSTSSLEKSVSQDNGTSMTVMYRGMKTYLKQSSPLLGIT